MIRTLLRPAMIFIPFVLGACFPEARVLNDPPFFFVSRALAFMVFIACLQIRMEEIVLKKEHFRLAAVNLLMGVLPFFLLSLLCPSHPEWAKAAFFVGIAPTATAAPVVVSFLNERVGFALTGFVFVTLVVVVGLIGLLPLVAGNFSLAFIGRVGMTLGQVIVLPIVAAAVVRFILPRSREWPKKLKMFSFSLWSANLLVLAALGRQFFLDHPEVPLWNVSLIVVLSLAVCVLNFTLGRLLGGKRYARECGQLLGQKNTTFVMYLALEFAGPLVAMGPVSYIFWHNSWNAIQMFFYDRHRNRKRMPAAS